MNSSRTPALRSTGMVRDRPRQPEHVQTKPWAVRCRINGRRQQGHSIAPHLIPGYAFPPEAPVSTARLEKTRIYERLRCFYEDLRIYLVQYFVEDYWP